MAGLPESGAGWLNLLVYTGAGAFAGFFAYNVMGKQVENFSAGRN